MQFKISKNLSSKGGVYIIRSVETKDCYIGMTNNFWARYTIHKYGFKKPRKTSPQLLIEYVKKYGSSTLIMEMLVLEDDRSERYKKEYRLIKKRNPSLNKPYAGRPRTK